MMETIEECENWIKHYENEIFELRIKIEKIRGVNNG
tara:strand:+ start:88 stop:195 length:108 start_codon:yes stop_codon:yes gene_type:complete